MQLAALGEAVLMPNKEGEAVLNPEGDGAGGGTTLDQGRAAQLAPPPLPTAATEGQRGTPVRTYAGGEQPGQQQQRREASEATTVGARAPSNVLAATDAPARPVLSVELDFTRRCATCGEAVHFAPAAFCHVCGSQLDAPAHST